MANTVRTLWWVFLGSTFTYARTSLIVDSDYIKPLIQRGIHPGSKPQHFLGSEKLWDMIERCWKLKPEDRPTMSEVCGILEKEYENLTEIPV
jgi:hypothetical protein